MNKPVEEKLKNIIPFFINPAILVIWLSLAGIYLITGEKGHQPSPSSPGGKNHSPKLLSVPARTIPEVDRGDLFMETKLLIKGR